MRRTRVLIVAISLLGSLPATAQFNAHAPNATVRVPAKPGPVRTEWESLIGEYQRGTSSVTVLERDGQLLMTRRPGEFTRLHPTGRGTFEAGNSSVTFSKDAGGTCTMRLGKEIYTRLPLGDVAHSFRITPLRPVAELRSEALRSKPPVEVGKRKPDLVELTSLDPTIKLDIRYATSNNFMGAPFYSEARAFLQRPAAESLVRAHRHLRSYGYGLLIHDAYRPWFVTKMFWDATPLDKKDFVADPAKGSNHNRGVAVDVSLYDVQSGREVEMPGGYDEMSDRSHSDYPGGTSLQRWRRDLLRMALERNDFKVYRVEWWHFDYRDWESYPILNVPFSELPRTTARSQGAASPRQ